MMNNDLRNCLPEHVAYYHDDYDYFEKQGIKKSIYNFMRAYMEPFTYATFYEKCPNNEKKYDILGTVDSKSVYYAKNGIPYFCIYYSRGMVMYSMEKLRRMSLREFNFEHKAAVEKFGERMLKNEVYK